MSSYTFKKLVGEGASALSYLAESADGQRVLVKRFKTSIGKRSSDFRREVDVLRGLNHPQIPRYIDSYTESVDGRLLPHLILKGT